MTKDELDRYQAMMQARMGRVPDHPAAEHRARREAAEGEMQMPMSREIARAFMWGIIEVPAEPKQESAEMTDADRAKIREMFPTEEPSK